MEPTQHFPKAAQTLVAVVARAAVTTWPPTAMLFR